jgi:hypothetical protein
MSATADPSDRPGPVEEHDTEAVSVLRGPAVSVNSKRIAQILLVLGMATLAVLGVLLLVSGAHRNAQITELHQHGQKVQISVSGCIGVASGSGSTPATFTCRGSFALSGHRHNEIIGGQTARLNVGSIVQGVAVPDDPALVATTRSVATEHTSFSVFILPIVLLVAFAGLTIVIVLRRRGSSP